MTISPFQSNHFYWTGLESDSVPGLTEDDVLFGHCRERIIASHFSTSRTVGFTVNGSSKYDPGGIIDDTAAATPVLLAARW